MFHTIHFINTLIDSSMRKNSSNEASCWYLVQSLRIFQWRIPSVWKLICKQVHRLLDHSSELVRDRIAA